MQMILQLLFQVLAGTMGMDPYSMQGGCSPSFGGPQFSPHYNPGFGGSGGGGGGGNPCGHFLGSPNGHSHGYGSPSFGGGRNGTGLGTNAVGPVGDLGSGSGADAVRWALSQEGVSEAAHPNVVRGYSRGNWQAWCADFVSTAYRNAGGSPFGHQSSVQGILDWGRSNPGRFMSAGAARNNPGALRAGDIAVWKQNGRSHVGLVTGVNRDGTFSTIEGNTSDRVARRTHSFGSNQLTGFVRAEGTFGGRQPSGAGTRTTETRTTETRSTETRSSAGKGRESGSSSKA